MAKWLYVLTAASCMGLLEAFPLPAPLSAHAELVQCRAGWSRVVPGLAAACPMPALVSLLARTPERHRKDTRFDTDHGVCATRVRLYTRACLRVCVVFCLLRLCRGDDEAAAAPRHTARVDFRDPEKSRALASSAGCLQKE